MHLRITEEVTRGGKTGESRIFYLREVPHDPGRTIQATGLTVDAALWTARRIQGVTRIDVPGVDPKDRTC